MEKDALLELVAEILEVEEASATESLEDQGWDSLANLAFIAEIDERLGVQIDADELAKAVTVDDLQALISAQS